MTGRFGVFAPGRLRLAVANRSGQRVREELVPGTVSPRQPVTLDQTVTLGTEAAEVTLEWLPEEGRPAEAPGVLGRVRVPDTGDRAETRP